MRKKCYLIEGNDNDNWDIIIHRACSKTVNAKIPQITIPIIEVFEVFKS